MGGVYSKQVVVRAVGRDARASCTGAHDRALPARHDGHPVGHRKDLASGGQLSVNCAKRGLLGAVRARDHALRLRVDDVVRLGLPVLHLRLHLREQAVQGGGFDRLAADIRRRADERRLEVKKLELCCRPDDLGGGFGILDAGKLDHDLVVALRPDLGLRDTELVDAVAHDLDRAVEVFLGEVTVRRRNRLQRDLEPALEVEPERRRLVQRRAGGREQRDADERYDEQPEYEE